MSLRLLPSSLVLLALLAGGEGYAQGRGPAGASALGDTDAAVATLSTLEAERTRWQEVKDGAMGQYRKQLATIDDLKRKRSSWRRDRQLRDAYAESQATARKLAELDRKVRAVDSRMVVARAELARAVERELSASPDAARRQRLAALKRRLGSSTDGRHRIVLPSSRIDPLATAEELEEQARLLGQAEAELAKRIEELEQREARLLRMAKLRGARARATELALLDDDTPRRTTGRTGSNRSGGGVSAESDQESPADPAPGGGAPAPGFGGNDDSDGSAPLESPGNGYAVILADVVDAPTLTAYRNGDRSRDPGRRAAATRKLKDQAKSRLDKLRQQRREMLEKARQRRR